MRIRLTIGPGMVGAINAPDSGNTFEAFLGKAKAFTGAAKAAPSGPVGGVQDNEEYYTTTKAATSYTRTWTYTTSTDGAVKTVTATALTTAPAQTVTVTKGSDDDKGSKTDSGAGGSSAATSKTTSGAGVAITAPAVIGALNAGAAVLAAAAFL